MTTRTLTHPTPGPVTFDARSFGADIEVTVTDIAHATVTVNTADTDGPSHDAVAGARITDRPGQLSVRVSDRSETGGITIVGRGNSVSISAVSVGRNVSIVGGRVFVNGAEVTDTLTRQAPVTVRAELPRGSKILASTESGQITTSGPVTQIGARTVSGAVSIDHAENARADTTSGRIEIRTADQAVTHTVSGATLIDRARCANADSVSGSVTIREATGCVASRTVSGDIAIWHTGSIPLTRSVSGRVHVTALNPAA